MYIILEIQTFADGTVSLLTTTKATKQEAESKYHSILSFAAVSSLPVHAASLLTNEGREIYHQSYTHEGGET